MKFETDGPVMACRRDSDGAVWLWTEPPALRMADRLWLTGDAAQLAGPMGADDLKDNWTIVPDAEAAALLAEAEAQSGADA